MLAKEITQCIEDMQTAAESGKITLEMQIRAYDLLDKLLDIPNIGIVGPAESFREEYYNLEADLKNAYKEEELKKAAEETVAADLFTSEIQTFFISREPSALQL